MFRTSGRLVFSCRNSYITLQCIAISNLDVTFAHYGDSACKGDYAVATNGKNDDLQHPIESEGIIFDDVQEDFKIIYHRPNVV